MNSPEIGLVADVELKPGRTTMTPYFTEDPPKEIIKAIANRLGDETS